MMDIGTVTSVGIHFMTDCCLRKRLIIFIYSRKHQITMPCPPRASGVDLTFILFACCQRKDDGFLSMI